MSSLHAVNIMFRASGKIGCNYSFLCQIQNAINYNTHLFHQSLKSSLKTMGQTSLHSVVIYALGITMPKQFLILLNMRKERNVRKCVLPYGGLCKVLNVGHLLWLKKKKLMNFCYSYNNSKTDPNFLLLLEKFPRIMMLL